MIKSFVIILMMCAYMQLGEQPASYTHLCGCHLCEYARQRVGVTDANVKIRFIEGEYGFYSGADDGINEYTDINQFADYHTFTEADWTSGMRTLVTTDKPITDFRFVTLVYRYQRDEPCCDELCLCILVTDTLYTLDELTPNMPLLLEWHYRGCFTSSRGVSFVYNGVTQYFDIDYSSYNGHLYLRWFER
jgi:hypothetical protein